MTCSVEGCSTAKTVAKGLCSKHYTAQRAALLAEKKCSAEGCDSAMGPAKGLCAKHYNWSLYGRHECVADGCERPAEKKGSGMCSMHDRQRARAQLGACEEEGCEFLQYSMGLCKRHYNRDYANRRGPCQVDGCSEKSVQAEPQTGMDMCNKHLFRMRNHGSVSRSCSSCGAEFDGPGGTLCQDCRTPMGWLRRFEDEAVRVPVRSGLREVVDGDCWEVDHVQSVNINQGSGRPTVASPWGRAGNVGAHRVVWSAKFNDGDEPPGVLSTGDPAEIDHVCHNKMCANPDHLQMKSGTDNRQQALLVGVIDRQTDRIAELEAQVRELGGTP